LSPFAPSELASELQAFGVRWLAPDGSGLSRAGGAGPSDHKAVSVAGNIVMVPILNHASVDSPYSAEVDGHGRAQLYRNGTWLVELGFPAVPRFYSLSTKDGIPYHKIATLHAADVLATTVLQTCTRYGHRETSCQFCAIGASLARRATIAEKTPAQLAEVAHAAVEMDGVRHMVMTTGTPATPDRGALVLAAAAEAVRQAVDLPIQAQCEPPDDFAWFERLHESGVDSLGLHLEAVTESVRARIMPGKAEIPVSVYMEAFEAAVDVFGFGQVTTYILAGLGDSAQDILNLCRRLIGLGVYPFVVPFVPIKGTPLEHHAAPSALFMESLLSQLATLLLDGGLSSQDIKAGCGRCGACSSLRARESGPRPSGSYELGGRDAGPSGTDRTEDARA
jgi:radical SAM protein (TIGR04043 family)